MAKRIAAAEWPALLAPGHRVWVSAGSNEPVALLEALAAQREAGRGVTFIQFPLPGLNRFDFTALHEEADMLTFFMTPDLRRSRARFLPMQMRFVFEYLRRGPLDVALIQVARARDGGLVVGPNVDFVGAVLESARVVVAELNHGLSAPAGGMRLDEDRVDYVVESDRPPATIQPPAVDNAARRIGAHVAEIIRDGDCIQTGIGAIPMAILGTLTDKNDLGSARRPHRRWRHGADRSRQHDWRAQERGHTPPRGRYGPRQRRRCTTGWPVVPTSCLPARTTPTNWTSFAGSTTSCPSTPRSRWTCTGR